MDAAGGAEGARGFRPKLDRRLSRKRPDVPASAGREKIKYAFIGLSGNAGATALAFAFAEYLASRRNAERRTPLGRRGAGGSSPDSQKAEDGMVGRPLDSRRARDGCAAAVVEINDRNRPPDGFDYDRIGIDKRFAGREYVSFYSLLSKGRPIRGLANRDGGVNWALRVPGEEYERFEIVDFIRLIDNAVGDTVICDISGSFGLSLDRDEDRIRELRKILDDMDRVCVAVDPLPSAMMADREKPELFKDYESSGGDVVYLLNKFNPGVNLREVKNFLRVRNFIEIPYFSPADIYAAEYGCNTIFSVPAVAEALSHPFEK
ncbi:MAG: hypothetical protein LBH63_00560, partial [Clostridiales Family XIII bacterium]|nr:hypothetical protein [Clostridiales Family XIII bacterium]